MTEKMTRRYEIVTLIPENMTDITEETNNLKYLK